MDEMELKADDETLTKETLKRMGSIGFNHKFIDDFRNYGRIYMSIPLAMVGKEIILTTNIPIEKGSKEYDYYKNLEDCFSFKVFHVIKSDTNIGEMYSYLYVSRYSEDWEFEKGIMQNNIIMAYVENRTHPECSDNGSIYYEVCDGNLFRTF